MIDGWVLQENGRCPCEQRPGGQTKFLRTSYLEVQPQLHGDIARTVLRAGRASEIRAADGAVYAEIGPVKRIERVGHVLQPHSASIPLRPHRQLLDYSYVVH